MSRIAKMPIPIPAGVQVEVQKTFIKVSGPNGILYQSYKESDVTVKIDNSQINVSPSGRQKDLKISYYQNLSDNFKIGIKALLTDDLGHISNNFILHRLPSISSIFPLIVTGAKTSSVLVKIKTSLITC